MFALSTFRFAVLLTVASLACGPLARAITINTSFVPAGGVIAGMPATGPSPGAVGGGDLFTIFNQAAATWDQAIGDPAAFSARVGWADLGGGGVLAVATAGGDIAFNSQPINWYLDPAPFDNIEYQHRWNEEQDLGAGTVNVARVHYIDPSAGGSPPGGYDALTIATHELGHVLGIRNLPGFPGPYVIDPGLPFGGSQVPLDDPHHFDIKLPPGIPFGALPIYPRSLLGPYAWTGVRTLPADIDILAVASVNGWTQVNLNPGGSPSTGIPYAKWSQLPENMRGENIPSQFDWRQIMEQPADRDPDAMPAQVAAEDFISDGRPIEAVRWWGSYFNEFPSPEPEHMAPREQGFVVSFFSDIPADPAGGFSRPGQLLGTYILPLDDVEVTGTDLVGWDGHNVVKYEARLEDAILHHAISGLSEPEAFYELAGDIYWISIAAWDGHRLDENNNWVDTGQSVRKLITLADGTVIEEDLWGWHTSPDAWNDLGVIGTLDMFNPPTDWDYHSWRPFIPVHGLTDFAFELLTRVPEPSGGLLLAMASVLLSSVHLRRGKR